MSLYMNVKYEYEEKSYKTIFNKEDVDAFYTSKRDIYEPLAGETIFVIARHGENQSNVDRTFDGRTLNLPLTVKGYAQGEKAGVKLSNKVTHIDHVITTPMCRTHQTAMKMLEAFPLSQPEFTVDSRFLERSVGKYEGGPLIALEPTNKEDKRVSASPELSFEEKMRFTPEENVIESYASIWERAHESLQQASSDLKGKVVLTVTHSGTIRSVYWHLAQQLGFFVPYANFKPDNGAYMIVSVKDGKMTLLETDEINIIPPKVQSAVQNVNLDAGKDHPVVSP